MLKTETEPRNRNFYGFTVWKMFNGSVPNRFGFDPLKPNQTIADCYSCASC